MTFTVKAIKQAHAAIGLDIPETPFLESQTLSQLSGATVYLKFENLQFTGSFKQRGALNKLLSLSADEREAGVVAVSAGNHAQGVAYHAAQLGIKARIFMPESTPQVKAARTKALGADVVLTGHDFEACAEAMEAARRESGETLIHPYDDWAVIAGQGTIGLEMTHQKPGLDAAIISIGGGGLLAGVGTALKAENPNIAIYGVQSDRFASMHAALRGKQNLTFSSPTIAEGIAVLKPGQKTKAAIVPLIEDIFLVSDAEIEEAVALLLQIEKTLCEGAGAAGLAALMANKAQFSGQKVGLILCGGNIDNRLLVALLQRQLVREGRLIRLAVMLPDRQGALGQLCKLIGETGGNINTVSHDRTFIGEDALDAMVQIEVELADSMLKQKLLEALCAEGFKASVLSQDLGLI